MCLCNFFQSVTAQLERKEKKNLIEQNKRESLPPLARRSTLHLNHLHTPPLPSIAAEHLDFLLHQQTTPSSIHVRLYPQGSTTVDRTHPDVSEPATAAEHVQPAAAICRRASGWDPAWYCDRGAKLQQWYVLFLAQKGVRKD